MLVQIFLVTLSLGILQRREGARGGAGFIPQDLEVVEHYRAYLIYFQNKKRLQQIVVLDDDNVYRDDIFQKTVELDKKYVKIE